METSPKKLNHKFTYKDYLGWPEGERWELINGAAYDMSPDLVVRTDGASVRGVIYAGRDI